MIIELDPRAIFAFPDGTVDLLAMSSNYGEIIFRLKRENNQISLKGFYLSDSEDFDKMSQEKKDKIIGVFKHFTTLIFKEIREKGMIEYQLCNQKSECDAYLNKRFLDDSKITSNLIPRFKLFEVPIWN